jgi:hypothetical protein
MRNTLAECRRCWCPAAAGTAGPARCTPGARNGIHTAASAVQLPIGFLTASLASPGLEARARAGLSNSPPRCSTGKP